MWCFSLDVLQKVAFVLPDDRHPESMTNFPYPRRALLRTYKINLLGTKIVNISIDVRRNMKTAKKSIRLPLKYMKMLHFPLDVWKKGPKMDTLTKFGSVEPLTYP